MSVTNKQTTAMSADEAASKDRAAVRRRLRLRPQHFQYAIPYGIVVSVLYLFGYWGTFHVNPLEYIGIVDVVKLAVYPLSAVLVIGAMLAGAAHIALVVLGKSLESVERRIDAFLANRSKGVRSLLRLAIVLIAGALQFLWLYAVRDVASDPLPPTIDLTGWHFLVLILIWICGWLAIRVGSDPVLSSFVGSRLMAVLSLYVVVAPIACAFPAGRMFAHDDLREGCAPVEIDVSRSSAVRLNAGRGTYLGYLGDHVFMREWTTGAIIVTRFAEGRTLVLLPLDTRSDGRPQACIPSRRVATD